MTTTYDERQIRALTMDPAPVVSRLASALLEAQRQHYAAVEQREALAAVLDEGGLTDEERKYLRLLISRDVRMLAKKRVAAKDNETREAFLAEKTRKIESGLAVYARLRGDVARLRTEIETGVEGPDQ